MRENITKESTISSGKGHGGYNLRSEIYPCGVEGEGGETWAWRGSTLDES